MEGSAITKARKITAEETDPTKVSSQPYQSSETTLASLGRITEFTSNQTVGYDRHEGALQEEKADAVAGSLPQKLFVYIGHGSIVYGKGADKPDSRAGSSYQTYDPNELSLLIYYDKLTQAYLIKQYRHGATLESAGGITSAATVEFGSAAQVLEALRAIIISHSIQDGDIFLAVEGNIEVPTHPALTENYDTFVDGLNPGRLVIFSNTAACRDAGREDLECKAGRFSDARVCASTELRQTVHEMRGAWGIEETKKPASDEETLTQRAHLERQTYEDKTLSITYSFSVEGGDEPVPLETITNQSKRDVLDATLMPDEGKAPSAHVKESFFRRVCMRSICGCSISARVGMEGSGNEVSQSEHASSVTQSLRDSTGHKLL